MSLPVITSPASPQSVVLPITQLAAFTVTATSDHGDLSYQWYKLSKGQYLSVGGGWYSGATTNTLYVNLATAAYFGTYACKVTNGSGSSVSPTFTVTEGGEGGPGPNGALVTITTQPSDVASTLGGSATFSIVATSPNGAVTYTWNKVGSQVVVPNGNGPTLTIDPVTEDKLGRYYCDVVAPGMYSPLQSNGANLTLAPTPTGGSGGGTPTGGGTGGGTPTGGAGGTVGGGGTVTFEGVGVGSATLYAWQGIIRVGYAGNGGRWRRDGDFGARPCGPPIPELPFQQFGDRLTAIWRQPWRVAAEKWAAGAAYDAHPDAPTYFLIKEGLPEHRGAGVLVWERSFCPVPQTHYEYESFPYAYQYVASSTSLASLTRSVTSRIKCEYFLERDAAAFPELIKDEMYVLPTTTLNVAAQGNGVTLFKSGVLDLHLNGTSAFFLSASDYIVAENSRITTWNYPIMCRATRYVPAPNLADLGKVVLSPPGT